VIWLLASCVGISFGVPQIFFKFERAPWPN